MTNITYLRDWSTNLGNLFIYLGTCESLKAVSPDLNIYVFGGLGRKLLHTVANNTHQKISQYFFNPFFLMRQTTKGQIFDTLSKIHLKNMFRQKALNVENFYDISLAIHSDFTIISGCILNVQLGLFAKSLIKHKNKKRKIIFNAVGGTCYSNGEIEMVQEFLTELKPYAIISRDSNAFKHYKGIAEHSYDGIDAAFFVSSIFNPPKLNLPSYYVLCFDRHEEPKLKIERKLFLRTSHITYPPFAGNGYVKKVFQRPNLLVSEDAKDYLSLYANSEAVFSDRVHACIAALSLGTPCRLYNNTPRAELFDRVNLGSIKEHLVFPDSKFLEQEKKKQINFLKEVIK